MRLKKTLKYNVRMCRCADVRIEATHNKTMISYYLKQGKGSNIRTLIL